MASGTTRSVVTRPPTYQAIIGALQSFWEQQGCVVMQPYHTEVGAGTFNPATFLRCLDARPWRAAYVEPSTRPADGRYGENPFRLGHYFQYQVVIKPSPPDIQDVYLQSLQALGVDLRKHDVRFVEDNWEGPTLGAWGQGWEVWADGMEITQFTYFQQLGGFDLRPGDDRAHLRPRAHRHVPAGRRQRLRHRLEPLDRARRQRARGHLRRRLPRERARVQPLQLRGLRRRHAVPPLPRVRGRGRSAVSTPRLPIPAYDYVLKCSHAFNMLDARGVISVTDRTAHIASVRDLARKVAGLYLEVVATARRAGDEPMQRRDDGGTHERRLAVRDRRRGAALQDLSVAAAQLRGGGTAEAPGLVYETLAAERLLGDGDAADPVAFAETRLKVMVAPRRIAVLVERRAARADRPDVALSRARAPMSPSAPDGTPTKAGEGFARGKGLTPADARSARPSTAPSSWSP